MATGINGVSSSNGVNNNISDSSNTVTNASLTDKSLFVKLLASSLANQDPLNPQDTSQFTQQLTQYSMIETISSVKNTLDNISLLQQSMNMYSVLDNATNLVGKTVEVEDANSKIIKGTVDNVKINDNGDGIKLVINNNEYDYSSLKSIYKN